MCSLISTLIKYQSYKTCTSLEETRDEFSADRERYSVVRNSEREERRVQRQVLRENLLNDREDEDPIIGEGRLTFQ